MWAGQQSLDISSYEIEVLDQWNEISAFFYLMQIHATASYNQKYDHRVDPVSQLEVDAWVYVDRLRSPTSLTPSEHPLRNVSWMCSCLYSIGIHFTQNVHDFIQKNRLAFQNSWESKTCLIWPGVFCAFDKNTCVVWLAYICTCSTPSWQQWVHTSDLALVSWIEKQ